MLILQSPSPSNRGPLSNMSNGPIPVNTPQQSNAPQLSSPSPLASPAHTNTPLMNTPASTPTSNVMSMQNSTSSMGKSNASGAGGSGPNQNDRATPIRTLSMQSQMSALESAAQERDEDSQSPSDNSSVKGKCDIKQEHDIKSEMDEETNLMDSNSNNSNSNCGGKNINNDMSNIKSELKTEAMDQGDNNSADSENDDMNEVKDEIKDEPMSPSDVKPKVEKKSTIPEPIEQDMTEKDKKKKCRTYLPFAFLIFFLFCFLTSPLHFAADQFDKQKKKVIICDGNVFLFSVQSRGIAESVAANVGEDLCARRIDAVPTTSRSSSTSNT